MFDFAAASASCFGIAFDAFEIGAAFHSVVAFAIGAAFQSGTPFAMGAAFTTGTGVATDAETLPSSSSSTIVGAGSGSNDVVCEKKLDLALLAGGAHCCCDWDQSPQSLCWCAGRVVMEDLHASCPLFDGHMQFRQRKDQCGWIRRLDRESHTFLLYVWALHTLHWFRAHWLGPSHESSSTQVSIPDAASCPQFVGAGCISAGADVSAAAAGVSGAGIALLLLLLLTAAVAAAGITARAKCCRSSVCFCNNAISSFGDGDDDEELAVCTSC